MHILYAAQRVGIALTHAPFSLYCLVLKAVAPLLVNFVPRMKLTGMGEEDRFFLYFALQAMIRARLIMYAPTIPAEKQANLPFVEFMSAIEQAIAAAQTRHRGTAEVLVFPYGGITYPDLGA